MQDEFEDNQEDYLSLTHEDCCDLLSKIEVKDNRKIAATQINNIASDRASSRSDSEGSVRIPRNKKSRTGVLLNNKGPNKAPKHHGSRRHCVSFNKAGMSEQKYMSYSAEDCFGESSNQKTINDVLGGPMGSRAESVTQYKRSESKWKKYIKAIKNQDKMLYSIANKSVSRREIKNIKKIRDKAFKNLCGDSRNSSSDYSDYDSSLSSNSD